MPSSPILLFCTLTPLYLIFACMGAAFWPLFASFAVPLLLVAALFPVWFSFVWFLWKGPKTIGMIESNIWQISLIHVVGWGIATVWGYYLFRPPDVSPDTYCPPHKKWAVAATVRSETELRKLRHRAAGAGIKVQILRGEKYFLTVSPILFAELLVFWIGAVLLCLCQLRWNLENRRRWLGCHCLFYGVSMPLFFCVLWFLASLVR